MYLVLLCNISLEAMAAADEDDLYASERIHRWSIDTFIAMNMPNERERYVNSTDTSRTVKDQ